MDVQFQIAAVLFIVVAIATIIVIAKEVEDQNERRATANASAWWDKQQRNASAISEAWRFWRWCNAVTVKAADGSYTGPVFTIRRNSHGMWRISAYKGHRAIYGARLSLGLPPEPRPNFEALWTHLGPQDGFLTERAAIGFLDHYLARADVRYGLDAKGHRITQMESSPGDFFISKVID